MMTERALLVGGDHHLTEIDVDVNTPFHNMMKAPEISLRQIRRDCDDIMMTGKVATYEKRYKTERGIVIMEPVQ